MANGLTQVPQVSGWGDLAGWTVDLGSGMAAPGGAMMDEYGNLPGQRRLTQAELAPYLASWNSPASVSGRATAQAQDNGPGFNLKGLVNAGLMAGVGGLMGAGALGIGGLGGTAAGGIGDVWGTEGLGGLFSGPGSGTALTGDALGLGAGGAAAGADAAWGANPGDGIGNGMNSDPYGNTDLGYGTTGTDPAGASAMAGVAVFTDATTITSTLATFDVANSRCYLPTKTATGDTLTIAGSYEF